MNRISHCGVTGALLALACSHASGAWAAGSIEAPALPAFLAANAAPQPVRCEPVGDDVLAGQSGKYAGSDMISGFVLSVLSRWDLPNGAAAIAQGAIAVAQNTANQIIAQVETSASVTESVTAALHGATARNSGAAPAAQVAGGQKVAVNGVSQVTQVAGNGNVGTNAATVDYSNAPAQLPVVPGATSQPAAFAANATGSVQAGISFAGNGINVAVQTPAGIATQSVVPASAQQAGAIAQLLQIAGNNQQVANQLALSLRTQPMSAAMIRQTGVLQALRNAP